MNDAVQSARSATALMKSGDRLATFGDAVRRVIIVGAVLITFGHACGYDFINLDDYLFLARNPLMNPPTWHSLRVFWTTAQFQMYDPLTFTVQAGVALVAHVASDPETGVSLNPRVFHAFNIALHAGAALLTYQILLQVRIRPWPACMGTLFFAIHPVQVEPVVWITAIKDLLCGGFGLLAIWRLLVSLGSRSAGPEPASERRRFIGNYLLSTLCFVLAMLSKPTAVILPLVAMPLVWLQCRRIPRRGWLILGSWFVLAIPIGIIARYAQPAPYTLNIPIWRRFFVAGDAMAFYLFKIVWPKTLLLFYGRNPAYILHHRFIWWTWVVPAALFALLWRNRRKCAPPFAGMCVFTAALLPVLGFVGFNFQYYSTVSDRYLYLSMFGIAMIFAGAVERAPRRLALLSAVPLLLLAGRSILQVHYWQDSLTLFGHVLESDPNSAIGNTEFAMEMVRLQHCGEAVGHARKAVELDPSRCEPYDALARSLDGLGRTDEALQAYRDGWRRDVMTRALVSSYALQLLREGDAKHAVSFARLATEMFQRAAPYVNLGSALAGTNDWQGARKAFEKAVSLDPKDYNAQCNLATADDHLGDHEGAIAHYRAAESINPDLPAARKALERLQATIR
jgi:Flp pilus assembly protein TadD